jgi:hypothetical protein
MDAQADPGTVVQDGNLLAGATAPPPEAAPWFNALGDDFRQNPSLSAFTGFEAKDMIPVPKEMLGAMGKAYVETKSFVGKKFQAPSETSTPEEVAQWRKTVGAPDAPEGYGELRPSDFPEDQWDKETAAQLAQIAHKHHLPAAAVKDIIGLHAAQVKTGLEKYQQGEAAAKEAGLTRLKQEWGAEFDAQAHAAKTFAKSIGLDPDVTMEFASPGFVLAMARGAKLIMGDKAVQGAPVSINGGIESRIQDLIRSPEYLGERGGQAQTRAQEQLHALYNAKGS